MQPRLDSLMQQRQLLDQQINALSQYQVPPININNNMTPAPSNYDFNGKWVTSEQEAKGVANNNLPLILFDKNEPVFYMKNLDGSFKKYKFMEVVEQKEEDRIGALEAKLNAILASMANNTAQAETSVEKPKKAKGATNEQSTI